MRSKKVALYAVFDSLSQIVRSVLSIYVRRLFILTLGDGLLGLNGLFSSIVSFLSLAELGLGSVVSVCLYQSLAENNRENISAYMNIIKKTYRFLGIFVLVGGLSVFPIVKNLVNGEYEQTIILGGYFLHLLATSVSYLCSYRATILYANQDGYIVSRTNLILYSFSLIAQIIVLSWKKSYFGFLLCTIIQNMLGGVWLTRYVNKKYNHFFEDVNKGVLSADERLKFVSKFKAMLVYKISDYLIQGADNMIISVFLGTIIVGYYNNYNLIINMCWAIFASIAVGSVAGMGNLIYTEADKVVDTMYNLLLLQHFIFCISATGIFQLSTLFVTTFLSDNSLLPISFVALLAAYYYFRGISYPLESVRMGAGVFENDKWQQLAMAILNIIISVVGCIIWGIEGVVFGTLICYLLRGIRLTPKQIFGIVLEKKYATVYYKKLALYSSVTISINIILYYVLRKIQIGSPIIKFLVYGIMCVVVSLLINLILFCKTREFEYFYEKVKNIGRR